MPHGSFSTRWPNPTLEAQKHHNRFRLALDKTLTNGPRGQPRVAFTRAAPCLLSPPCGPGGRRLLNTTCCLSSLSATCGAWKSVLPLRRRVAARASTKFPRDRENACNHLGRFARVFIPRALRSLSISRDRLINPAENRVCLAEEIEKGRG